MHVLELADDDLARLEPPVATRGAGGEPRGDLGVAGDGGASGPHLGQPVQIERRAGLRGELDQPRPLQPLDAPLLALAIQQDDGRHRVGIESLGQREVGVDLRDVHETEPLCLRRGLVGRRLRHHPHAGRVERGQHRVTDRAVVLDQGDELGRHRSLDANALVRPDRDELGEPSRVAPR